MTISVVSPIIGHSINVSVIDGLSWSLKTDEEGLWRRGWSGNMYRFLSCTYKLGTEFAHREVTESRINFRRSAARSVSRAGEVENGSDLSSQV